MYIRNVILFFIETLKVIISSIKHIKTPTHISKNTNDEILATPKRRTNGVQLIRNRLIVLMVPLTFCI